MLEIEFLQETLIEGQTCGKIESSGVAYQYKVSGSFGVDFICVLQFQEWLNGEKDIICVQVEGHPVLTTTIGRMRLSIRNNSNDRFYECALKTAQLRSKVPPHANLKSKNLDFYREILNFDLSDFLQQFGDCKLGAKEELIGDEGRTRNQLMMIFDKTNREIPMAAFIATRVFPLLLND